MEEDNDIYEMFLAIMKQLRPDAPAGRMRILSKDPRYSTDDPAIKSSNTKHIER